MKTTYDTLVLGAGLAGLSAAHVLSQSGRNICVVESDGVVGGLARTIEHHGFRFDLGGHRVITHNKDTERFIRGILNDSVLEVPRKSQIFLQGKFFDYPLKPGNAILGLGPVTILRIVVDYLSQTVKNVVAPAVPRSFEDWVISKFGRALFDLYFRQYTEKVWGVPCDCISVEWAAKRIEGLSLWTAVKNAFSKRKTDNIKSLADKFLYPRRGIGELTDRMRDAIAERNPVLTATRVVRIDHTGSSIANMTVAQGSDAARPLNASRYLSSIPITDLVSMLRPAAPEEIRKAAAQLQYRDLVIVTIMLRGDRVTDLSWMYLPGKDIPFGRIHEPKNWSAIMAPEGKTHVVAEYFCFKGDRTWNSGDAELVDTTVRHLCKMGFISERDVIDSFVLRVPNAYPLLAVDYRKHYDKVVGYLNTFKNLHLIGRTGKFRYYNMDHAIESGLEAAETVLRTSIPESRRA